MAAPRELDLTVTLNAAWESWRDHLHGRVAAATFSPDSARAYLSYARYLIDALGSHRTCDSIEPAEITAWLSTYRAKGVAPGTVRHGYKVAKALFRWVDAQRWLREDPMRDVPHVSAPPRHTSRERAALTRPEYDALLAAARAGHGSFNGGRGEWVRDEIVLRLAGESGLRNADIQALDLGDIEQAPEGHWVVQIRLGKGRKARTTPITDACAALIREYVDQWRPVPGNIPDRRNEHGKLTKGDAESLLLTAERHRPNSQSLRYIVSRCAKAALGRHYIPHGLRHTAGTLLAREARADLAVVAHVLGHSDVSVTSVYLDTRGDEAAAAVNRRKTRTGQGSRVRQLPPGQDIPTWEECGTRKGWQRHRREKVPRCGPCRLWYRGAQEELAVLRRLMPERLHGTRSGFRDWKCRCERCDAAKALSDSPDCRLVLPPRLATPKELCPGCGKRRSLTAAGVMRRHPHGDDVCPGAGHKPAATPLQVAPDLEPRQITDQDDAA